jgi:hypothetical protein
MKTRSVAFGECQQIIGLESEILWEARSTPTLVPSIPGIPWSQNHCDNVCDIFQWLGSSHNSPMTNPEAQILWDSSHLEIWE